MARQALTLFLSFCFLLLNGSSYMRLPVLFQSLNSISANISQANSQAFSVSQSQQTAFHSATRTGSENVLLNAMEPEDSDDEDPEVFSRCFELCGCPFRVFYLQPNGNVQCGRKKFLPAAPLSLSTVPLYLQNQVIKV